MYEEGISMHSQARLNVAHCTKQNDFWRLLFGVLR